MIKNERNKDWHRADVIAALHKNGVSLSGLSIANNLGRDTLRNALRTKYPKAEKIIAKAIGISPSEIWPSRYCSDYKSSGE